MRTQVAIIGAGPAGLFLAHLLHRSGIACVVIEWRDRAYVEARVRAGVLEQITVDLMGRLGLDARLNREGLAHRGTNIVCDGELFHIDIAALTGGRMVTVYGQQEVVRDLFDAAESVGLNIVFDAADVELHDLTSERPFVTWRTDGREHRIDSAAIAGWSLRFTSR